MREVSIESIPVNRTLHRFPRVIIFEIVAGCNLRCIMCPQPFMTRPHGVMDFNLYKRCVEEIALEDPNVEVWATIMGELLLHGDLVFNYLDCTRPRG